MFDDQQVDATKKLPTQQYLDAVFIKLNAAKETIKYREIEVGTVFKGFKTIPIQELESKKVADSSSVSGQSLWHKDLVGKVYCYEQSCPLSKKCENGFFKAFYDAYINHGDVKITPDDVWMAIMLFFTKYVDDNAEKLRSAFVQHKGQKQLIVKTLNQNFQQQWDEFFEKVIVAIKENTIKGVTENFQCSFSTTDKFFSFFSTAIIMNSFKKYFKYTYRGCACGIQNIHMGGYLQDWQKLSAKLSYLKQFDVNGTLKKYVERLEPVLDQFVQTYKGQANLEFWNNIYHEREDPNAHAYQPQLYANGWILRFFTLSDVISSKLFSDKIDIAIEEIDVPIQSFNHSFAYFIYSKPG